MKLECVIEKIKTVISQVEKITGKNLTLPILNSILILASKKSIILRATNLSLGIEVEIPAKVEKEGMVAITGSVLVNTFSNIFTNENVYLEGEGGNLSIKTKKNKIKLKGQVCEDFPTIPKVSGVEFEIEARKLIEGIKSVYYSSSVSDVKPEISSIYIYSEGEDLVFVSTDSFRLAEKKIKYKQSTEVPGILIPFKNIPDILRVFGEYAGTLIVCFNKNQVSFSGDGVYLTSRIIDGVFPDYRQIIPKEKKTEAVVLKQDLLNALKISNIFSDKFNQVNLIVNPKNKVFELSSSNSDVGDNKTEVDATLQGEEVELSFNYKYFLDCFQSLEGDSMAISFDGTTKPIKVSSVSDRSFTYLIMPMNR